MDIIVAYNRSDPSKKAVELLKKYAKAFMLLFPFGT